MSETETKETFCGACLAVPLAFAGAGMAGVGSKKDDKNNKSIRKRKKIMFWSGIAVTIVGLIIALLFLRTCKNCR
jgi:hypothetical protein